MHKEYSMVQRRRNVRIRILLIVLAALLILGVGLLVIRLTGTGASLQNQQTHLFQVGAHPLVTVSGSVGTIHIHTGEGGHIAVVPTIQSRPLSGNSTVTYTQRDLHHLTIVVSAPAYNILGSDSVNFDITVPVEVDLQLQSGIGDIVVDGVHGRLIASSGTGIVKIEQALLSGSGTLQTNAGSITFEGSFASHAQYQVESNVGSLYVTLPSQSSLHLDAVTATGTIHTTRSGIQVNNGTPLGGKAHGDMNENTLAVFLSLKTNTGSITLQ